MEAHLNALVKALPLPKDLAVLDRVLITDGDLTPQGSGVAAAALSLVLFTILYKTARWYTGLYFKGYKDLPVVDRRDWDTRLGNIAYSYYIVYEAVQWLVVSDLFKKPDPTPAMIRNTHGTYIALGVSVGFFFVDMLVTVYYWMGGGPMVLHHIGSLTCVTAGLLTGHGHQMTLWMLSTEFTTPYISYRFLLDKGGLRHSNLYLINGVLILASWTVARLATFPLFFYTVWQQRDSVQLLNPASRVLLMVFPATLAVLNTWWYTKIVHGAIKIFGGKKPKADKTD